MRITVDIEECVLNDLALLTGESKKSPAVAKAVTEFVKRAKAREFGKRLMEGDFAGSFDEDYDPKKFDK
ncbi:MAG: DUF2191 domain-containing protein [Terrimicrobiaceae bacterium]